jgi:LysR family carnitine catabolism transcriptional activator
VNYPTVKQLRAFVAVARTGSFVRASELLHLSQPALSETIVQLERVLGGRMFERTTRTVMITPFGEVFLPRASGLLSEIDRACRDMRELVELERGHVSMGCLTSIASQQLPQIIATFRASYPNIRLGVRDDNAAGLHRRLVSGEVDFAITSRHEYSRSGMVFQPLRTDPFRLLCPVSHPLAGFSEVPWRAVTEHFYIGWSEETANRFAIDTSLASVGIMLEPSLEIAQLGTMLSMVQAGVGVAAVPRLACPSSAEICSVALVEPEITREVGLATLERRPLTAAAKYFMGMVRDSLAATDVLP